MEMDLKVLPPKLAAQPKVSEIAGIGKSEIWRRVKAGTFPAPVHLGPRCTRWNLVEVETWVRERLAERGSIHRTAEARAA